MAETSNRAPFYASANTFFMTVGGAPEHVKSFFVDGRLPKVGEAVETVCVGIEDGELKFRLRVVGKE